MTKSLNKNFTRNYFWVNYLINRQLLYVLSNTNFGCVQALLVQNGDEFTFHFTFEISSFAYQSFLSKQLV